ncbi:MAG: hypothetical protein HYX56_07495 [Chloroflexi bacterium]|nr:hypothetical protein [Chloroflexota bacterium]
MPIYDYRCDHCGHAFSQVQTFTEEAVAACPSCGKKPRRLITMPAIVFKGSGWYKTDSRGAAPAGEGDTAAKPAASTETAAKETAAKDGGATKSEAKPKPEKSAATGEAAS